MHVIVNDGAVHKAASEKSILITAHKTLEDFIKAPAFQQALKEQTQETVAANIEHLKAALPNQEKYLAEILEDQIVHELSGTTVQHRSIPDDNHEGVVITVGLDSPEVNFDFATVGYYGANELAIDFDASVECSLNYAIFKADYYALPEDKMDRISIGERNEHYFDADEDYTIEIKGVLSIKFEGRRLEDDNLTDEDVEDIILQAEYDVEVVQKAVAGGKVL